MNFQAVFIIWLVLGLLGTVISIYDDWLFCEDEWSIPYILDKIINVIPGPVTLCKQIF